MRFAMCLMVGLLALAAGRITFDPPGALPVKASALPTESAQSDSAPKILDARLKGKKLIVTGENFGPDAAVFVDGERQKTKNDSGNPSTVLIAKKAGKKMRPGEVVSIHVLNEAGPSSTAFGFFSGRTVTFDDGGKTIDLRVGERIMLVLKNDAFDWVTSVQDSTVLKKVTDADIIPGSQGIFEAQRAGETKLAAQGDPHCSKLTPPCMAPAFLFELNVAVQ